MGAAKPRLVSAPGRVATLDTRKVRNAETGTNPFYLTVEWRSLVKHLIKVRGYRCEDPKCKYPDRKPTRLFGDHIVELADGGAKLDPENVMLRCGSCHTRKTNEERAKRMAR
ncbi:MAG TPA: HNH endonuclease signature motif containing protein [Xanthobacteraceae bacterium]|nr:HNH endonuclease signature motif containing protein [Xanthobacteraceae bacterium]